MAGLFLLQVSELAARGEPVGTVTVVHDAGDHGGRYRDVARALAESQWAVALPDMRGHGGTEGDRGHSGGINEVVRDLGHVQDHLSYRLPDAPRVLIGQGLGALYAAAYAIDRPGDLAGLVLVSPLHEPAFELPQAASGLKRLFKKVGPKSAGRIGYETAALFADSGAAASWTQDSLVHDVITLRAGEQAREAASKYLGRLSQAKVPTLVLHGADDPIASAETSRGLASDGIEVQVVDGGKHRLLDDGDGAAVVARVIDWLTKSVR